MKSWAGGRKRRAADERATSAARTEPAVDRRQRALVGRVEEMSGVAMDDVRVHYGSSEPGKVGADAFAAGSDVHLGPGHEGQLGHELWHVAQQRQGRVAPSLAIGGIGVNVDASLEREADAMGSRASLASVTARLPGAERAASSRQQLGQSTGGAAVRQFACGGKKKKQPWSEQPSGQRGRSHDSKKTFAGHEGLTMGEMVDFEYPIHFDDKNRVVTTETHSIREWRVDDPSFVFYSAVREASAAKVDQFGLDPAYGGSGEPKGASDWLSRGHVYFGLAPEACALYGDMFLEGKYVMFTFNLPEGSIITEDPEYPQGLRTRVKPINVKRA